MYYPSIITSITDLCHLLMLLTAIPASLQLLSLTTGRKNLSLLRWGQFYALFYRLLSQGVQGKRKDLFNEETTCTTATICSAMGSVCFSQKACSAQSQ